MRTVTVKHIMVSSDYVSRNTTMTTQDAKKMYLESLVAAGQTPDVVCAVQVTDIHFERIARGERMCIRLPNIKFTYEKHS